MTAILFCAIGVAAFLKKAGTREDAQQAVKIEPIEIALLEKEAARDPASSSTQRQEERIQNLPDADRIEEFFNKREPKLPIVETIVYKRRTPWLNGRAAWIADYASHYKTSRHFIARSLNEKPDYDKQDVVDGDCFNVFREDKDFEFYLVVDVELRKMWFFYYDKDHHERVLLKTYPVGLGRYDENAASGSLTPLGKYTLGDKVAVYRPNTLAHHRGKKVDMVSVFGTRWIPFDKEVAGCTASPKGLGIHGLPLQPNQDGELVEDLDLLGKNESDGCIRLATKDMEELFAIVISRPTTIELVKNFHQTALPGEESTHGT